MAEQKAKVVKVGRGGPHGPRPKVQNPGKIFMRILRYVMECYRIQVVAVVICIFVSVFANVQGTLFMQTLIDGYILPLLKEQSSDFSGLAHAIARTAGFYGIGIVAAFAQARMMAYVTQGTLKRLRDEMFTHMQTLPIKYFDRNAHGDIMSLYTNDIDTLRQMISQSMPQLLNSAITVVSVLVSMVVLSVPLTVLTLVMVGIMLLVTKYLTTNSSKYFVSQQRDIGAVNGYIEEMMGQKAGQLAQGQACHARQRQRTADHGAEHIGKVAQLGVSRTAEVGVTVGLIRAFKQLVIELIKLLNGFFLVAEHLNDLLAVQSWLWPAASVSLTCWTKSRKWTRARSCWSTPNACRMIL